MRRSTIIKSAGFVVAVVVLWRLASEIEHARREGVLVRVGAREGNDGGADSWETPRQSPMTSRAPTVTPPVDIPVDRLQHVDPRFRPVGPVVVPFEGVPVEVPLGGLSRTVPVAATPDAAPVALVFAAGPDSAPMPQAAAPDVVSPVAESVIAAEPVVVDEPVVSTPAATAVMPTVSAAVAAAEMSSAADIMVPTGAGAQQPLNLSGAVAAATTAADATIMQPAVSSSEERSLSAALDRSVAAGAGVREAVIAVDPLSVASAPEVDDSVRVPRAWPWLIVAIVGIGAIIAGLAMPVDPNAWAIAGGGIALVLIAWAGSRRGVKAAKRARAHA